MEGEDRVNIKARQLYDSVTDTSTSQVRVYHVFVLTSDRLTDLVGYYLLYVHPTLNMTHRLKLCCGDSFDEIAYLDGIDDVATTIKAIRNSGGKVATLTGSSTVN
jgi:hypothetical protein